MLNLSSVLVLLDRVCYVNAGVYCFPAEENDGSSRSYYKLQIDQNSCLGLKLDKTLPFFYMRFNPRVRNIESLR